MRQLPKTGGRVLNIALLIALAALMLAGVAVMRCRIHNHGA